MAFHAGLASFYGLPRKARKSIDDYRDDTLRCAERTDTSLLIIDDFHHLKTRRRDHDEVNGQAKDLISQLTATVVFVGVDAQSLLSEGLHDPALAQMSGRLKVFRLRPFRLDEDAEEWRHVVAAFAERLVLADSPTHLYEKPQMLKYLHRRTSGRIGSLSDLLRDAADHAVHSGSEKIDRKALDAINLDLLAESQTPADVRNANQSRGRTGAPRIPRVT